MFVNNADNKSRDIWRFRNGFVSIAYYNFKMVYGITASNIISNDWDRYYKQIKWY